ncbi:MAG: hypothetical protein ABF246_02320 [Winogradskyella sp.]
MNLTLIFITAISVLIVFKLRDISLRNKLSLNEEKRLVIAGGLFILFFVTNITLPYPQSLYWFIFTGIALVSFVLSFGILKKEIKRLKTLKTKDVIINVAVYSLFFVVIHLYI